MRLRSERTIRRCGMYAFESDLPNGGGLKSYGEALWWTAMLLTSLGSEYWPRTAERARARFILALYGFAVFGYMTATIATFFVGRDLRSLTTQNWLARSPLKRCAKRSRQCGKTCKVSCGHRMKARAESG